MATRAQENLISTYDLAGPTSLEGHPSSSARGLWDWDLQVPLDSESCGTPPTPILQGNLPEASPL